MNFALKNRVFFFFCKVIVSYKMKIKGVTEDLKILKSEKKKEKNDRKIVKIYLGLSLVLLWAVWGQFVFR